MSLSDRYRACVAHFYDRSLDNESKIFSESRRKVVEPAEGDVLELGAGTGANLSYYLPEKVKRLVLVEPDRYMLAKLEAKKSRFNLPLETMLAEAEKLPFPDNSFDYVITTLVLCTVRDLDKSLAEILRVLKPGGELRFFEHVRSKSGIFSAAQTMMTPVWKRCSLGCHLNRDTFAAIKRAGFHFCDFEDSGYNLATLLPLIDGYAQKAGV